VGGAFAKGEEVSWNLLDTQTDKTVASGHTPPQTTDALGVKFTLETNLPPGTYVVGLGDNNGTGGCASFGLGHSPPFTVP
jgi:hypothetical protein